MKWVISWSHGQLFTKLPSSANVYFNKTPYSGEFHIQIQIYFIVTNNNEIQPQ